MTRLEAVTLALRCLRQLCRDGGIPPARSFGLEASFESLLWQVSDTETPEDWRDYLDRTDPRNRRNQDRGEEW
jgi:hypothetical protein